MTDRYTGPVGLTRPQAPILGPGGVTGHADAPAPIAQTEDSVAQWGAEAGRLARRAQFRPQLPDVGDTPQFPIGPGGVSSAPATVRAAHAVGVPERYLSSLVGQESGGDADAQAPTSSATGHAQFTDQTWFNMMGANAERYGQPQIAAAFMRGADGHYKLTNPSMRDSILDLRRDPTWAALMGGEYARENDLAIRRAVGRDLNQGEVYLGHWLGPAEATTFLQAYDRSRRSGSGRAPVARGVVSDATFQANMPIFYTPDARFRLVDADNGRKRFVHEGGGRLRTVAEVYQAQTAQFGRDPFIPQDRAAAPPSTTSPQGMIAPGNINLNNRPVVHNQDGSISTVRSIGVEIDGRHYLIPTVSDDGRILSDQDAVALFRRSGRHLGEFSSDAAADSYGQQLHESQARLYGRRR